MNKELRIKYKKIISLVVFVVSLFTIHYSLFTVEARAQARIPLVVSPARTQINLDPGSSENFLVKFYNESSVPVAGNLKVVDFIVEGKEGKPILLDNIDYPISNQYSGASWVNLPYEKASIASGDVLRVNYKISVPEDAAAGGRYVAIYFESTGSADSQNTNEQASITTSRIVSLLYIRVNGPISESAYVDVFKTPVFLQFGPIPVNFEIFNKGNYHITPNGQLTLTNWFNKEIDEKIIEEKNIFPNTKRVYSDALGSTWMFGKYKVDLEAAYGQSGKVTAASSYVWVLPIALILTIILGLTVITLTIILVSKKFTKKQKDLEEKLEKELSEVEALKAKFKDKLPKK